MADKKIYHMLAKVENCEIRSVKISDKSFKNKKGETVEVKQIELMCDYGDDCERIYFVDKDMSNAEKYKKGQIGTFTIRLDVEEDFGAKCKITVVKFEET